VSQRLSQNVRRLREARGLTVEEAAAAAGLPAKQWEAIEAGDLSTTLETLDRVTVALSVAAMELVEPPAPKRG